LPWDFIGNERAVAALTRALREGRPAHAYLFVGPERVGKATLALRFAQTLNCTGDRSAVHGEPVEPCGACQPCRRVAAGLHADVQVVTVEPAAEGPQHKAISVGQIREVERAIALHPFEGRSRVVIIDPADAMNTEAQNAFLKTLEEPPPHVAFVLVAVRGQRLLPTIRSRCRRVEFRLLPITAVEQALREAGLEAERARLLARLSRGRIGWALEMVRDPSRMERRHETLASARSPATMTVAQRFELAERLATDFRRDREAVLGLLLEWQGWWRDVLLAQTAAEDGVANVDMLAELREDARRYGRQEVLTFLRALLASRHYLEENVQPRLVLETLLLEAPEAAITANRS